MQFPVYCNGKQHSFLNRWPDVLCIQFQIGNSSVRRRRGKRRWKKAKHLYHDQFDLINVGRSCKKCGRLRQLGSQTGLLWLLRLKAMWPTCTNSQPITTQLPQQWINKFFPIQVFCFRVPRSQKETFVSVHFYETWAEIPRFNWRAQ